jgi:hypothetical protein
VVDLSRQVSDREAFGLVAVASGFVAGVLLLPSSQSPLALSGLVALVAFALLLEVELPWGGTVSMGHAVVIAFAGRLSVTDFLVVVGLAFALILLPQIRRYGPLQGFMGIGVLGAAAGAGLLGRLVANALVSTWSVDHRTAVVAPVVLAGVAYIAVVLALQYSLPAGGRRLRGWRSAVNVYASLLCAAVLLALASERSTALGAVTLVPLLILRFSFRRYFDARQTYLQTTQALSMIPEVAGLTPLGHGERTAVYAGALAEWLEFSPPQIDAVATLARLHHIGQIAYPDFPDRPYGPNDEERRLVGEAGTDILAGTGFLKEVAPLVAALHSGAPSEITPIQALVRVASTLDDLVGPDPSGLSDAVVGLLARHETGIERTVALKLAQLCDAHPEVAERAVAAGSSSAAAGAQLVHNAVR